MHGKRFNDKKPRMGLLPPYALREVAAVLTSGCEKYGVRNWMLGLSFTECLDSCQRHIASWQMGIDNDAESGLPHLAHAACNLLMLLELSKVRPEFDDRVGKLTDEEMCLKPAELLAALRSRVAISPAELAVDADENCATCPPFDELIAAWADECVTEVVRITEPPPVEKQGSFRPNEHDPALIICTHCGMNGVASPLFMSWHARCAR